MMFCGTCPKEKYGAWRKLKKVHFTSSWMPFSKYDVSEYLGNSKIDVALDRKRIKATDYKIIWIKLNVKIHIKI